MPEYLSGYGPLLTRTSIHGKYSVKSKFEEHCLTIISGKLIFRQLEEKKETEVFQSVKLVEIG